MSLYGSALGALDGSPSLGALAGGNLDPDLAWVSLLQANATYAWASASGLTLSTWTDVVSGVVATAGGTGTTIGTLAGRPAAVLNGSGRYTTGAFAAGSLAQPYAVVAVARRGFAPDGTQRRIIDGVGSAGRAIVYWRDATNGYSLFAGMAVSGANTAESAVIRTTFNGATSTIRVNAGTLATGNAGANAMDGITLGAEVVGGAGWLGSIADVIIVAGADYAARAATIEAAALVRYGL